MSEALPTQPSEKDGAFVLTETTSTAFPEGGAPSPPTTADGMGIVGIASVRKPSDAGGPGSSTARHNKLLVEAEMRAEHQSQARQTMLDLASALDESNARRHELAAQLNQEQRSSADLRKQMEAIQARLDEMEAAEEKRQADILIEKALKSGNTMVFGMLLQKSREVYKTNLFGDENKPDIEGMQLEGAAADGPGAFGRPGSAGARRRPGSAGGGSGGRPGSASGGSAAGRPGSAGGGGGSGDGSQGDAAEGGVQFGEVEVESFERSDAGSELQDEPARRSSATAKSRRASSWDFLVDRGGVGDRVTFEWTLKLWRHEVDRLRALRADEIAEAERKRLEEERKRQIEEEKRKAVEAIKKIAEALEKRLNEAMETIEAHKKRQQELEKELELAREEMAQKEAKHKEEVRKVQQELQNTRQELANMKGQLSDLQKEYDGALESLRKADQQFANERRMLQDTIRNITSELQEAMVLAKHMRETALKAKREAAGSVSPAKFAELIGTLEEMKSQLSALWKDCMKETETNELLRRQLDKNKRQLELERQFLPLLHKVRGPVGPKVSGGTGDGPKRKDATNVPTAMPPIAGQVSPKKLRTSQSLGALGGPLGGPLAGGRQSPGYEQQDPNRFTSRDFASSNGFSAAGSLLA